MNSLLLALPLSAAVLATPALAQEKSWSPFYGCWQADEAPANELLCIAPRSGGVRVATLIDGLVREESKIVADGVVRTVQDRSCRGVERARWSADGERVLLDSDIDCGGARQKLRGVFAFVAPDEWVNVQSVTMGDSVATRVVHFTAANVRPWPAAAEFQALDGSQPLLADIDEADVAEVVAHVGTAAAQEWLRAAGEPYHVGYGTQERNSTSALAQLQRFSNQVVVREVVHVVEQPVYVYNPYVSHGYRWYYSPWGYRYHAWHWHRPVVVVGLPIVIYRNSHYHRDYWRTRRYDPWRYDRRQDPGRYIDRRSDDDEWRGGRATRDGYRNGREGTRSETRSTSRSPDRGVIVPARTAAPRSGSSQSDGYVSRSSSPRTSTGRTATRR